MLPYKWCRDCLFGVFRYAEPGKTNRSEAMTEMEATDRGIASTWPSCGRRPNSSCSGRAEHDLTLSEADARAMVHELEVHQIELEMQNEELQRDRQRREESEKYGDLFDFAPVGYFLWDARGADSGGQPGRGRGLGRNGSA